MIDFPATPTPGQVYNPGTGPIYTWDGVAWNLTPVQVKTARAKNLIVNPSMQVSQENGNTGIATGYPADQWWFLTNGFTALVARSQSFVSPDNSQNTLIHSFSVAKASLAAGDYCQLLQPIEGQRAAELAWGTTKAIPAVLRFNAACEQAGTYTAVIQNGAGDYSWLGAFTCDGTTNLKTFVFPIPAQPSGAWAKDNTQGLSVRFVYAAGTTYQGAAGWQAGSKLALTGSTNGAAVINKNMIITDVGLYADPDNTGLPPPFELPDFATELVKSQRYYYGQQFQMGGYSIASGTDYYFLPAKASMRTTPTVGYTTSTSTNCSAAQVINPTTEGALIYAQIAATGVYVFNGTYKLSARM